MPGDGKQPRFRAFTCVEFELLSVVGGTNSHKFVVDEVMRYKLKKECVFQLVKKNLFTSQCLVMPMKRRVIAALEFLKNFSSKVNNSFFKYFSRITLYFETALNCVIGMVL